MEIVLRVGSLGEFMDRARSVARAGDARSPVDLPKSRLSMYFETQDDLDDAVASAWVHIHNPKAFDRLPSFASPEADPLYAVDRPMRERIDRSFGRQPPWVRRQVEGGIDTVGTVGISVVESMNFAVLLFGVRLAMEHLAFLARFLRMQDPFAIQVTSDRKIVYFFPIDARGKVLAMYVQMQPDDDRLLHGLDRVVRSGGEVAFLMPGTVRALDALAAFRGGVVSDLPLDDMLETRLAFGPNGALARVVPHRLTQQEIESLSVLPGSRVRAA